jgi:hypothetical protein
VMSSRINGTAISIIASFALLFLSMISLTLFCNSLLRGRDFASIVSYKGGRGVSVCILRAYIYIGMRAWNWA